MTERLGRKNVKYSHSFEERMISHLEAQDQILDRLEAKLQSPILNGGFDDLVSKVNQIESVTEHFNKAQEATSKKIDAIHVAVYDPDLGLYHVVKSHTGWIATTNKLTMWLGGMIVAGILGGIGKLLYSFISGHIHFTP